MENKYISVNYKLYTTENNEKHLEEQTSVDNPFFFVSKLGLTLESFEKAVENLATGEKFNFILTPDEAYGERVEERVMELDKEMFKINGHFDHEHIQENAIVPLVNEDGNTFYGLVLAITEDKVKMDLNHPLAGKELTFEGEVLENRPATNEEIQHILNSLDQSCGCGGGCSCDSCGSDNGGCGCGGCH